MIPIETDRATSEWPLAVIFLFPEGELDEVTTSEAEEEEKNAGEQRVKAAGVSQELVCMAGVCGDGAAGYHLRAM